MSDFSCSNNSDRPSGTCGGGGLYQKMSLVGTVWALLKKPLGLWLGWLLVFQASRVLLVACTYSFRGDATLDLLFQSALHGLRFDGAMAVWLSFPFAMWGILRSRVGRRELKWVSVAFALISLIALFTLVSEVEFYKEFQVRFGPLVFEYFSTNKDHNATIFGMVWHGYPVVRWTLVSVVIWVCVLWVARRMLRPVDQVVAWKVRWLSAFLYIACGVLVIRSGIGPAPLRWGDAFFSQNIYANKMTLNGLWALMDAARHTSKDTAESKWWKKRMPEADAHQLARQAILLDGEKLVDPDKYPLLRVSPPSQVLVKKPRNVVVVIMESFTARFNDATGASFGATPNYVALAKEGVLYDRAFSVSTHTAPGVFGTLCSYPILPDHGYVMKSPLAQQPFRSLPRIFKENDFETLFLYNGEFSWDNKEGFFRHEGINRFIGKKDYVNPSFVDPDWGVCDLDVFMRAKDEFTALHQQKKPFFGVVLTLSNHAPFNLPKVDGLAPIQGGGDQNQRLNGVHYADWALGQFISESKKQPWFEDTLFVFVGDHGFGISPTIASIGLLHMHVPLLFYSPSLFGGKAEVRHQVASQLDILPTIVGMMGFQSAHHSYGRDLFRISPQDPGQALVKQSSEPMVGFIRGNDIYVGSATSPASFHHFDLSFPPSATEDLSAARPDDSKAMMRLLDGLVVSGLQTLEKRRVAPDDK